LEKVFYICTYGGSGSRMLESWFKQYGITYHVHDPYPPEILTHCQSIRQKNDPDFDNYDDFEVTEAGEKYEVIKGAPVLQNFDLNSWGGEELDLNKYKPYVIYVYSKPECSIWSRCEPPHWQSLHVPNNTIKKVCDLINIPIEIEAGTGRYQDTLIFDRRTENTNKINSIKYLNLDHDHLGYERFFYNYACVPKSYDILLLNYHYLWENLEPLFDCCGIPLEDIQKFPRQRVPSWEKTIRYWDSPTSTWEEQEYSGPAPLLEKAHNGMFKVLNDAINKLPKLGENRKHNNNNKKKEL